MMVHLLFAKFLLVYDVGFHPYLIPEEVVLITQVSQKSVLTICHNIFFLLSIFLQSLPCLFPVIS